MFEIGGWPAFPEGVLPHDSVDLDAEDPSSLDSGKRQCVGIRADGERCRATAVSAHLLCSLHTGRLDAAEGGRAVAEKRRKAKERAEEELGRRSLGTRATIAFVLHREHRKLELIVEDLLERASKGDAKAQALLPAYLNQALGLPQERVEHSLPGTAGEVAQASTASLAALVEQRRRLRAVPDESTG